MFGNLTCSKFNKCELATQWLEDVGSRKVKCSRI